MEGTVTISISRFKELERKEDRLRQLEEDKTIYFIVSIDSKYDPHWGRSRYSTSFYQELTEEGLKKFMEQANEDLSRRLASVIEKRRSDMEKRAQQFTKEPKKSKWRFWW